MSLVVHAPVVSWLKVTRTSRPWRVPSTGVTWAAMLLPSLQITHFPLILSSGCTTCAWLPEDHVDVRAGQQGVHGGDLVAVGFGVVLAVGVDRDDFKVRSVSGFRTLGPSATLRSPVSIRWEVFGREGRGGPPR